MFGDYYSPGYYPHPQAPVYEKAKKSNKKKATEYVPVPAAGCAHGEEPVYFNFDIKHIYGIAPSSYSPGLNPVAAVDNLDPPHQLHREALIQHLLDQLSTHRFYLLES